MRDEFYYWFAFYQEGFNHGLNDDEATDYADRRLENFLLT